LIKWSIYLHFFSPPFHPLRGWNFLTTPPQPGEVVGWSGRRRAKKSRDGRKIKGTENSLGL
jgi:hypothetical protein